MRVRFPRAARDFFLLQSIFSADSLTCVHVKDPVVHVRVQWIMETIKHPACTVGWVAWLSCSWLSPGKATRISHGRNPIWTIQLQKVKKKEKKVSVGIVQHAIVRKFQLSDCSPQAVCHVKRQTAKKSSKIPKKAAVQEVSNLKLHYTPSYITVCL